MRVLFHTTTAINCNFSAIQIICRQLSVRSRLFYSVIYFFNVCCMVVWYTRCVFVYSTLLSICVQCSIPFGSSKFLFILLRYDSYFLFLQATPVLRWYIEFPSKQIQILSSKLILYYGKHLSIHSIVWIVLNILGNIFSFVSCTYVHISSKF